MPVLDFVLNTLGIIENVISATVVAILTYMICGGWEYVFRAVSFFFDKYLVKLIGVVYGYFTALLEGTMFEEAVVNELMKNIYIFIGVIMFFRLMMLVIKYLVNPDLIGDAKSGANALIQRVIIGVCGILFIPTIFNLMLRLQVAILNDNLIQQIIVPKDMLAVVQEKVSKGGNYIGTYVWAGFMSPNSNASSSDKKQFELGIEKGDLSNIDINDGGFLTQRFKYDYFVFISTLALGYVLYLMLKYCIDIAVRCFKLLLFRLLSPVAMIEYMINGSQDGVYKNWLNATISTYVSLFVRILAVWFVIFVMALMSGDGKAGYAGNLLTADDYFLRAIIIIALLGFMMDLPKIVGQIFGLDLEQEGSAMGVLKQVGGMVKGAAIGGLAIGGAAIGSLAGGLGGAVNARRQARADAKQMTDADGNKLTGKALRQATQQNLKSNMAKMNAAGGLRSASAGILTAAMGSNQFTGAFANSFSNNKKQQESVGDNVNETARKKKEEQEEKAAIASQRKDIANLAKGQQEQILTNRVERVIETQPSGTDKRAITGEVEKLTFNGMDRVTIQADVEGRASSMTNMTAPKTRQEVEQVVTRAVQQTMDSAGIQCSNTEAIVQRAVVQAEMSGGLDLTKAPADLAVEVSAIAKTAMTEIAAPQIQQIEQVVNQTYGTRVNNAVDDATQKINQEINRVNTTVDDATQRVTQQLDQIVTNTEESVTDLKANATLNREQLIEAYEANGKDEHGNPKSS